MSLKPTEIHKLGYASELSAENGNTRVNDVRIESTELYVSLIISIGEMMNHHLSPRLDAN